MLIEFRVTNFRSIRDEQVLSLVASKDETLHETNTVKTGIQTVPRLLRSAVMYGPNAGGKSNLIKALQYMRAIVVESATRIQPGQIFNVKPFLLDNRFSEKPSVFEVTFLLDGVRHQYGFSLNQQRITDEYLLVYRSFKPQTVFSRYFDEAENRDVYSYGSGFRGAKKLFEKTTRPNALFLSVAAQLNHEMLGTVYDWFNSRLVIFNELERLNPKISVDKLEKPDSRQEICDFLTGADISLKDIDVSKRMIQGKNVQFNLSTGEAEIKDEMIEQRLISFVHETAHGQATFDLNDESAGTRNLLFMAGPFLDIMRKGMVCVVDEFETSLHPLLVRRLVRMFHDSGKNTGNAQLIFTTHDVSLLLEPPLFRRDQVWFVEKDQDQASVLSGLLEFSPRKNEALGRGYLMGRYGAIPFFDDEGKGC